MPTSLEIIRGIAQAAADGYDGALDENGEPIKIGLKREEGNPILDSRTMDGFKCSIMGDKLILKYQTEIHMKDVHDSKFEEGIDQTCADIVKYLKKRYKKITGNSVSLTKEGETNTLVQRISNIRTSAHSTCTYKIGGMSDVIGKEDWGTPTDRLDASIRDFLSMGRQDAKKPMNITRKED